MDLLGSCPTCFKATLSECGDEIIVRAGLAADSSYYFRITDKFFNVYSGEMQTNGDGDFTLEVNRFPIALFTRHSGSFTLEVSVLESPFTPVQFWLCDTAFFCIQFSFVKGDGMGNEIYCSSSEEPLGLFEGTIEVQFLTTDSSTYLFDGTVTAWNPDGVDLRGYYAYNLTVDGLLWDALIPEFEIDPNTGILTFNKDSMEGVFAYLVAKRIA